MAKRSQNYYLTYLIKLIYNTRLLEQIWGTHRHFKAGRTKLRREPVTNQSNIVAATDKLDLQHATESIYHTLHFSIQFGTICERINVFDIQQLRSSAARMALDQINRNFWRMVRSTKGIAYRILGSIQSWEIELFNSERCGSSSGSNLC